MSDALKIVTQEDIELAKRATARVAEPITGDDVDPAKLMDLLGDIDGLKHEIHERMRRIEAVKQAKSVLLEDAERTEALNKRLAEIGKAMSVAHVGILGGGNEKEDAEPARMQAREAIALPWPRVEENQAPTAAVEAESVVSAPELHAAGLVNAQVISEASSAAIESALQRLEETEAARLQAWMQADAAVEEAKRLLDEANSQLNQAVSKEEQTTADFYSAQQSLAVAYASATIRLEEAEAARSQAWAQANETAEEARRLLDEANAQLMQAISREEQAAASLQSAERTLAASYESIHGRFEEAEAARSQAWAQANGASEEAKRLLDEANAQLKLAVSKEEQAAASLQAAENALSANSGNTNGRFEETEAARSQAWTQANKASEEAKRLLHEATAQLNRAVSQEQEAATRFRTSQEALTAASRAATERMEEAERSWVKTDQAAQEAKQLLDRSSAELVQARKKEESIAANLQSVRQEFMSAYESASERLREAEKFWQRGDQTSKDVQKLTDLSTAELLQARTAEQTAAADLLSARQELTTAYQFAAVAAQRRLDSVEFFQKAARWTVFATALSWVAMVWMAWFAFRDKLPIWTPGVAMVLIVVAAVFIAKRGTNEG